MKRLFILVFAAVVFFLDRGAIAAEKASFEGYKKCGGCHKSQKDAWLETKHAKAMHSLKPGERKEEKKKAKLDTEKDYTQEKDCLTCHTTGFGDRGGYKASMSGKDAEYFGNIGCESCHGAGSIYRKKHSDAGKAFKATQKPSPRKELVDA